MMSQTPNMLLSQAGRGSVDLQLDAILGRLFIFVDILVLKERGLPWAPLSPSEGTYLICGPTTSVGSKTQLWPLEGLGNAKLSRDLLSRMVDLDSLKF